MDPFAPRGVAAAGPLTRKKIAEILAKSERICGDARMMEEFVSLIQHAGLGEDALKSEELRKMPPRSQQALARAVEQIW